MKKLLLAILVCGAAMAASVGFIWDDNLNPPTTQYRLYRLVGTEYVRVVQTAEKTVTVDVPVGPQTFVVRAVSSQGIESDNSNVVSVDVPHPPTIRIIVVP